MAIRFEDKSIPKRSGKTAAVPAETAKHPPVEANAPIAPQPASTPAGELSLGQPDQPMAKNKGRRKAG